MLVFPRIRKRLNLRLLLSTPNAPLYLNGSIHPEKRSFLGKKILKSGLSVFGGFYTHPDLFVFHLVGGLEALASEFAAGTIFTAVIRLIQFPVIQFLKLGVGYIHRFMFVY